MQTAISSDKVKKRPAVVVSVSAYQNASADAVFVALTARRVNQHYFGEARIVDWGLVPLPKASKAKGVVRTIERSLVIQRLGTLTPADMLRVQCSLRVILGI